MKTETNDDHIPRALRDVWEWKDSIYQDVKHLPVAQALRSIMDMAQKASAESTFIKHGTSPAVRLRVSESEDEYKTGTR